MNGIMETKDGRLVKVMKVEPINYNLKSQLEKDSILNSYKIFLKTCNFDFQILIQSNKENLSNHISKIKNNILKKEEKYLKNISDDYINFITEINNNQKSASKNFYIIISNKKEDNNIENIIEDLNEKFFKIKECLSRCGNNVISFSNKNDLINLFNSFLNPKNKLKNNKENK
jgi:hypothetical protein